MPIEGGEWENFVMGEQYGYVFLFYAMLYIGAA